MEKVMHQFGIFTSKVFYRYSALAGASFILMAPFSLRVGYYFYLLLTILFLSAQGLYFETSVMLWPYDFYSVDRGGVDIT